MSDNSRFPALFIGNKYEENREVLQECMEEITYRHMKEHPDTGAIIFECTNFEPFSRHVQDIAEIPVFGINQLVEFVASTVNAPSFY